MDEKNKIVVFEGKKIRRVWHNENWYYSIVDIIEILTDSKNPKGYLKDMRRRDSYLNEGWGQIATPLLIETSGGKQLVNCSDKKGILRIIQSIPSKKAEPFKLWLAKVGSERIDEIENPELAQDRAKSYYEMKGYPKNWIDKRIRGIAIRQNLTDEWKSRGVGEEKGYAILTNEISEATFGIPIRFHKKIKNLNPKIKNENLRDSMTDLELIFSMLGEASTTEIVRNRDIIGFENNFIAAREGGDIAGEARKNLEKKSGRKVVSDKNALDLIENDEMKKKRGKVKTKKRK